MAQSMIKKIQFKIRLRLSLISAKELVKYTFTSGTLRQVTQRGCKKSNFQGSMYIFFSGVSEVNR